MALLFDTWQSATSDFSENGTNVESGKRAKEKEGDHSS